MVEKFEYSITNPNSSLGKDCREWIHRGLGYNHLWTPSQYKVVFQSGFIHNYSGGDLPSNISPFLLTVGADYNLFGRSEPWEGGDALVVGLLLEARTRSFTLQNGQFRCNVRGFNTEYHLRYADIGLGVAELSEVTDDLVIDEMQYTNQIGIHLLDERKIRTIGFTKKGYPARVSWIDTFRRFLPVKDSQDDWVPPYLTCLQVYQNLLVPAENSVNGANSHTRQLVGNGGN